MGDKLDCPRDGMRSMCARPRLGSVRVKCRKLDSERRKGKDTASPCSFASFDVSFKVILHTYSDASEEVFICFRAAFDVWQEETGFGARPSRTPRTASNNRRRGREGRKR